MPDGEHNRISPPPPKKKSLVFSCIYIYIATMESIKIASITILTLFIPCIIVGNVLVILSVYKNETMRTPTNLILASMAFVDLLVGLIANPLEILLMKNASNCIPQLQLMAFLTLLTSGVSFLHIVAVTADRFIAVTRPLRVGIGSPYVRDAEISASCDRICINFI
ncbi:5-hydroxytryptamine receptor 2B-like [Strongylocentrotus purpuratus]|uniref:G-protein coupled receptors family 1 profile domain-containing protein n=1 Tax=Strongylocentrotus purpuratus TaxID=7668 RepID=A0A7M7NY80_STRPU|nr:5-hydroxytryptamine receptor 2B-like [Strongylocentrotus purpuratus]